MLIARLSWKLRNRFWYWPILALVAAFHVLAVIVVHFPRLRYGAITLMPIAFLDFAGVFLIFVYAEKWIGKCSVKNSDPLDPQN